MPHLRLACLTVAATLGLLGGLAAPAGATLPTQPPGCVVETHTVSATPAAAIPDNDLAGVTSTVTVPDTAPLRWVRVRVDITHPVNDQLDILLSSPGGKTVTLSTDNGGAFGNGFAGTLFNDDAGDTNAPGAVTDTTFTDLVPQSTVAPEEPLGAYAGDAPGGVWTLRVLDDTAGSTGTLNSWSLEYAVNDSPTLSTNSIGTSAGGMPIADHGTITQQFDVTAPLGGVIEKVTANLNITHTWNADLDITLTSPAGTVVTLTTDNGGNNDNVFAGTTFDDDAGVVNPPGAITDTTFATLVVETPVAPEEPLAAFRGEDPHGTWKLTVTDDMAGDTGTLVSWGVGITTASCGSETSLTGASAPAAIPVGGAVAYTLVAHNNAVHKITDATVTLPLPSGMDLVSASPSKGTCAGVVCTLGTLPVETSAAVTYVARSTTSGPKTATATLTQLDPEPLPADNAVAFTTAVDPAPPPGASGGPGGPSGGSTPPAKDTTRPSVVLLPVPDRLRVVARQGLKVLLGATEAGRLTLTLKTDARTARRLKLTATLGTLTRTVAGPGTLSLRVRPSPKAAKVLKALKKSVKLSVLATLKDAAGNAGTVSGGTTVKP